MPRPWPGTSPTTCWRMPSHPSAPDSRHNGLIVFERADRRKARERGTHRDAQPSKGHENYTPLPDTSADPPRCGLRRLAQRDSVAQPLCLGKSDDVNHPIGATADADGEPGGHTLAPAGSHVVDDSKLEPERAPDGSGG